LAKILTLILLLGATATHAAPEVRSGIPEGPPPAANVESLAWLAGRWSCEAFGGVAEEMWLPPAGGQMAGVFRLVRSEGPAFYEIMSLLSIDGRLTLRLKHFDAALHGWEAKDETVDFPLVAREGPVWFFDGMTIERHGDDAATVHVRTADGDKESIATFPYVRVGGP
jgi:hypothetical protein